MTEHAREMITSVDRNLHRYWIKLVRTGLHSDLGYGVTAFSEPDALAILRHVVYGDDELPAVVEIIADVDVTTLDQGHVVPNMGPPNWRGVWFPRGHDADIR